MTDNFKLFCQNFKMIAERMAFFPWQKQASIQLSTLDTGMKKTSDREGMNWRYICQESHTNK